MTEPQIPQQAPEHPDFFLERLDKALVELSQPHPRAIEESAFVKEFLPLLASKEPVDLRPYIDMAGGPFNPVDVYRGEEWLYRVPALADDRDEMFAGLQGVNVQRAVNEAFAQSQAMPALGDAVILHELKDRMKFNPISLNTVVVLNQIFERYGYPKIELPAEVQGAVQSTNLAETSEKPSGFGSLAEDPDNCELL